MNFPSSDTKANGSTTPFFKRNGMLTLGAPIIANRPYSIDRRQIEHKTSQPFIRNANEISNLQVPYQESTAQTEKELEVSKPRKRPSKEASEHLQQQIEECLFLSMRYERLCNQGNILSKAINWRIHPSHRQRFAEIISNDKLSVVQRFEKCETKLPSPAVEYPELIRMDNTLLAAEIQLIAATHSGRAPKDSPQAKRSLSTIQSLRKHIAERLKYLQIFKYDELATITHPDIVSCIDAYEKYAFLTIEAKRLAKIFDNLVQQEAPLASILTEVRRIKEDCASYSKYLSNIPAERVKKELAELRAELAKLTEEHAEVTLRLRVAAKIDETNRHRVKQKDPRLNKKGFLFSDSNEDQLMLGILATKKNDIQEKIRQITIEQLIPIHQKQANTDRYIRAVIKNNEFVDTTKRQRDAIREQQYSYLNQLIEIRSQLESIQRKLIRGQNRLIHTISSPDSSDNPQIKTLLKIGEKQLKMKRLETELKEVNSIIHRIAPNFV